MEGKVTLKQDVFGTFQDPQTKKLIQVDRYIFENEWGFSVSIITYGAAITSINFPGRDGQVKDIVLGFDDIDGYTSDMNSYFGASIGRVSNRIGKGQFTIDGRQYQVPVNNGPNSLHGGLIGFDKKIWEAKVVGDEREPPKVVFSLLSQDNDQGYPGNLIAQVTYQLTSDNQLKYDYQAVTTNTTPVALTNHSYFNLGGHDTTQEKLNGHYIQINADRYTPVDADLLTTGEILPVKGTIYELNDSMKNLGALIDSNFPPGHNGYDHNFCLNITEGKDEMILAVRVQHAPSGRVLEIHTDQPGLQFYSGNFLPDPENPEDEPVVGKGGINYWLHGAFCLETQNYPNAVNYSNFPNALLQPGEVYRHSVVYKMFTVQ